MPKTIYMILFTLFNGRYVRTINLVIYSIFG